MDQQRVVDMFSLVKDINFAAYQNLIHPTRMSVGGKDPIKDRELNERIRVMLMKANLESTPSALVIQMENYYRNNKYDAPPANDEFNEFMRTTYPESHTGFITPGIKYQGLLDSQRVYFGLFMASKRELTFN
jgi:hypothetical protein